MDIQARVALGHYSAEQLSAIKYIEVANYSVHVSPLNPSMESVNVSDVSLSRDGQLVFAIVIRSKMQGVAKVTGSAVITGWNIETGQEVLSIPCAQLSGGLGGGSMTEVESLKVSKDGTSLFASVTSLSHGSFFLSGSSSLKRWDLSTGNVVGEVVVGQISAGVARTGGTILGKLLQAKDGKSLFGVLTSSRLKGFRVAGAQSVVQYASDDFTQLRVIPLVTASMGIGGGQCGTIGDVKQTKDGRLLLVAVGSMQQQFFTMRGNTSIVKLDLFSGQEVGRMMVGASFAGMFSGQSVEFTSLMVRRDGVSLFDAVTHGVQPGVAALTVASFIMQWHIENGAVVKSIQTGMSLVRMGFGSPQIKGTRHEKVKQSREGKGLIGCMMQVEQQGFGVKTATWLVKWDVETGSELGRAQVGSSAQQGPSVNMSDLTDIMVSRDGTSLIGIFTSTASSMQMPQCCCPIT